MRRYLIALVLALATPAGAAPAFPPDGQWVPFRCGNAVMTDPVGDDPPFLGDLDLVGDGGHSAGFHASDATYLYLRIRLDDDPAPGGALGASAWGYEFDTDGDPTTYELLLNVNGLVAGGVVGVYANTRTTVPNSPTDPANTPSLTNYPFAMNARSVVANGSMFGGTADYYLDFAVPWAELVPNGLDHATQVHVWAGSSSAADNLNGDIACDDAAAGPATLDGTTSTVTPADPTGGGPGGPGQLVGGERCQVGGGGGVVVLIAIAFVLRRRQR
jgi:hypothetical protein